MKSKLLEEGKRRNAVHQEAVVAPPPTKRAKQIVLFISHPFHHPSTLNLHAF
jgi:hypothetical protein